MKTTDVLDGRGLDARPGASAHVCTNLPNFLALEFRRQDCPWRDEILTAPLEVEDGCLLLADGPGLGIDLDVDGVRRHLHREW